MSEKILIVGESNPYGGDPHYALYPAPDGCAGWRLCVKILGLGRAEYLEKFDRTNLLVGQKWSAPLARESAGEILASGRKRLVLLGRKVQEAFGLRGEPFYVTAVGPRELGAVAAAIPHPSGRCLAWNHPPNIDYARRVVAELEARPA